MSKSSNKRTARPSKTTKKGGTRSSTATTKSRAETKSAKILNLLGSSTGATIQELVSATGWQQHSVRGFLSGSLKKKQGLHVTSENIDGIRRYKISGRGTKQ